MDTVRLVSGDGKPSITVTITDEVTGDPIDVSAVTTTVYLKFRQSGTTDLLDTITCTVLDGVNGVVSFDFSTGTLTGLDAGLYEGELEIDFNGVTQTLYDLIKFRVRDEF